MVGLFGVGFYLFLAIFAPLIAPHPGFEVVGKVWEPPSWAFRLGTDNIGRDLLSRSVWGAQITIFIAAAATILSFGIGVTLGFFAAIMRGWIDQILSRMIDLLMAIPTLDLRARRALGAADRPHVLILVMAVLDSTRVFRISRAVAVDIAVMDFVEAARLRGEGWGWIMSREILPNALSPLICGIRPALCFALLFLSAALVSSGSACSRRSRLGRDGQGDKDGIVFGISAALFPGGGDRDARHLRQSGGRLGPVTDARPKAGRGDV